MEEMINMVKVRRSEFASDLDRIHRRLVDGITRRGGLRIVPEGESAPTNLILQFFPTQIRPHQFIIQFL
jgi:hypothetical protein